MASLGAATERQARFPRWLVYAAAGVTLFSVLVRAAYYREITAGPLVVQHLWDESDMAYFDQWARQIRSGDLLGRSIRPPLHEWHLGAAEEFLRENPGDAARLAPYPAAALWDRWAGGGRFYQDPLYPYLIAALYGLGATDVRAVFVLQLALGVLANLLVLWIAARLFGAAAGALAGLLAALCAPALYLEMVLVREPCIVFASLALVALALAVLQGHGRAGPGIGLGLATGLALLLKSHFVIFAAGMAVLLFVRWKRSLPAALVGVASFAFGITVALTPLAARNLALGLSPLEAVSEGGATFYRGNALGDGNAPTLRRSDGLGQVLERTRGALLPTAWLALRTHPGPVSYLALLGAKWRHLWGWYEEPDNTNYYYYRLHSPTLAGLPIGFLAGAPLGVAGAAIALVRVPAAQPLLLMLAATLAVPMALFPLDRFRVPLLVLLLPFAAHALVTAARWVARRNWRSPLILVAAVAAFGAWGAAAPPHGQPLVRPPDFMVPYETYYLPRYRRALTAGNPALAAQVLETSLRYEPSSVARILAGSPPRSAAEIEEGRFFADVRADLAHALAAAGRHEEAAAQLAAARQLTAGTAGVVR